MLRLSRLTEEKWRGTPGEQMMLAELIRDAGAAFHGNFALSRGEMLAEIASQVLARGTELESIWVLRDGDVPAGVAAVFDAASLAVRRQASFGRFLKRMAREDRSSCLLRVQEYLADVTPYSGDGRYLARIAVSPAYRNRGLGSRLMEGLIAEFGNDKLVLHVARENAAAIALYRKWGFTPVLPDAKKVGVFIRPKT